MYFLWGCANDFLTDVYSASTAITAAQNIKDYVTTLATVGARHFLVPNLPDLSLTPFVKTEPVPGYGAWAKTFSNCFNAELKALLGGLNPLLDIVQFDTYSFFNKISNNPVDYGFTNSVDACLSGSVLVAPPGLLTCAEPDKHIYWDGFHPTTRTHALFGTAFASAVPEPATIVLLAVSLIALSVTGRQRRRLYPNIKS